MFADLDPVAQPFACLFGVSFLLSTPLVTIASSAPAPIEIGAQPHLQLRLPAHECGRQEFAALPLVAVVAEPPHRPFCFPSFRLVATLENAQALIEIWT